MKKIVIFLFMFLIFLTGCNNKEKPKDYSGTFYSNDSSYIRIDKENNYNVFISIYKLSTFSNCKVEKIEDDILFINCLDPNNDMINFSFDYNNKKLEIINSNWDYLNKNTIIEFNN